MRGSLRAVSSLLALSLLIALRAITNISLFVDVALSTLSTPSEEGTGPSSREESVTPEIGNGTKSGFTVHATPVDARARIAPAEEDNRPPSKFDSTLYRTSKWIDPKIRKWGCNRMETPLIFVHIGKAGGGTTRARFAAAAQNYNRTHWYMANDDQHNYPPVNASFCTSQYHAWKAPSQLGDESYEGNLPCSATTPIGMALGCPEALGTDKGCRGCQDLSSKSCRIVYVGHNSLGSELHWLPPNYLRKWWRKSPFSNLTVDWRVVYPEPYIWCLGRRRHHRPTNERRYRDLYDQCSVHISDFWDGVVEKYWKDRFGGSVSNNDRDSMPFNYAPLYASLPLQRVTILREPWSWLVSKFFWHHDLDTDKECDDLEYAKDWANRYILQYTTYLCGDDCAIRLERGRMTMEEIWIQSETNLRQSFSVVGLLNETSTFYEMVSSRVAYLDMSLNRHVQGDRHTGRNKKTRYCHKLFLEKDFQVKFREHIPAVRLLERLFEVGEHVNRFQLEELRACQVTNINGLWSKQRIN